MNLEHFITNEFNGETVNRQVIELEKMISRTQEKIAELKSMQMKQNEEPWYEWDGVSFYAIEYVSNNGYRDDDLGKEPFSKFENFIVDIIEVTDPSFHSRKDKEYYIVSPNGKEHKVSDVRELPLVKEYFERKELNKNLSLTIYNPMFTVLQGAIISLHNKIQETEKYTASYIQTMKEEKEKKEKQLEEMQQKREDENGVKAINRIQEIDALLLFVDQRLKQKQKRESLLSW